jgi:hypothetical protein
LAFCTSVCVTSLSLLGSPNIANNWVLLIKIMCKIGIMQNGWCLNLVTSASVKLKEQEDSPKNAKAFLLSWQNVYFISDLS